MKNSDIPCPPPPGFRSADPKTDYDGTNPNDVYYGFPPKGHNEDAGADFIDAVWGVPDGRRGGK